MTELANTRPRLVHASFDVEADGPNPCQHSMRGLGIWLQDPMGNKLDQLDLAIQPRRDRKEDDKTMQEFWSKHPEAWKRVNTGAVSPAAAMETVATRYKLWMASYDGQVKWAAKPAAYDWMWLKCYYGEFAPPGAIELPHKCICISTMFDTYCDMSNVPHDKAIRTRLELQMSGLSPTTGELTHSAVDDARVQGKLLANLQFHINKVSILRLHPFLMPGLDDEDDDDDDDYDEDYDDDELILLGDDDDDDGLDVEQEEEQATDAENQARLLTTNERSRDDAIHAINAAHVATTTTTTSPTSPSITTPTTTASTTITTITTDTRGSKRARELVESESVGQSVEKKPKQV